MCHFLVPLCPTLSPTMSTIILILYISTTFFHSEALGFGLSIWKKQEKEKERKIVIFGNWICFLSQVRGGSHRPFEDPLEKANASHCYLFLLFICNIKGSQDNTVGIAMGHELDGPGSISSSAEFFSSSQY
jgi:hypothetical protein